MQQQIQSPDRAKVQFLLPILIPICVFKCEWLNTSVYSVYWINIFNTYVFDDNITYSSSMSRLKTS